MLICVTNRLLCPVTDGLSAEESFIERVFKIAQLKPSAVILREKDLDEKSYEILLEKIIRKCSRTGTEIIANKYVKAAEGAGARAIQLSYIDFTDPCCDTDSFDRVGVSVHSVSEAVNAQKNGADYLIAGHIFRTDCKKGIEPRGLQFLSSVCSSVDIPVYAIGGINEDNYSQTIQSGASGVCVMSGLMACPQEKIAVKALKFMG